jgi:hypothetical protein
VIDAVVPPLLHNKVPVKLLAVKSELPQLFVTVTVGAVGTVFGAEVPLPVGLVHPLTVCVTVYVAALVTVIEVLVAALLQSRDPVKLLAVNKELPQLFVTVTVGAVGIVLTVNVAALELTEPALLVHTARYCLLLSAKAATNVKLGFTAPLIFVHVVPLVLTCH